MGVLNLTPDSFSDGGRFTSLDHALDSAHQMLQQGADIIDIGGESTRPGALDVPVDQELDRIMSLVYACQKAGIPVSVDTQKTEVMREVMKADVVMLNDVNGFRAAGALQLLSVLPEKPFLCVMHMQGSPDKMQRNPHYNDVLEDIMLFLRGRISALQQCDIPTTRIIVDPGFGFGKTDDHNWSLLSGLSAFSQLGSPILAGLSRKSMFGRLLDRESDCRLSGSLAGALLAAQQGARILRVHDVAQTYDVLRVLERCQSASGQVLDLH